MGVTANNGFPYPDGTVGVAPDVPGDIKKLADAIDGLLGNWVAYNPGFSNTAALSANGEYLRTGRHVHFIGGATFQANGSVGGPIGMSLPVARRGNTLPSGRVLGINTGNAIYELVPILSAADQVVFQYRSNAGPLVPTGNQTPFGWTQGSQLLWDIWYAVD